MTPKVVAVALSGGVDSLVSGHLLKKRFSQVFGLHFITGYERGTIDTRALEDQLKFPVQTLDLRDRFKEEVVDYFTRSYLAGKTPNPCLFCNQKIKFGTVLDHALKLGADALATGHYATIVNQISAPDLEEEAPYLAKGKDLLKDQSYFLSMLTPDQLGRLIFPLADLTKEAVRTLARQEGLKPSAPAESQDICFIHGKEFAPFLVKETGIQPLPGPIIDAQGSRVGTHAGLLGFTVGQRRGINVPAARPYYVRKIDPENNTLHVCFKEDLASSGCRVDQINWNGPAQDRMEKIQTRIRYSHKGALSSLERCGTCGKVRFDTPQNAVTPGQAAVFYSGPRVLGAGIIQ